MVDLSGRWGGSGRVGWVGRTKYRLGRLTCPGYVPDLPYPPHLPEKKGDDPSIVALQLSSEL
jgi:hypothetical protein